MADFPEELYSYKETRYSARGIASTVLGGVSAVLFAILCALSASMGGNIGEWAGALGFTAFAAAFVGMMLGLKSFADPCRSFLFCKLGTVLCGLMVAVWFLLFCVGLT